MDFDAWTDHLIQLINLIDILPWSGKGEWDGARLMEINGGNFRPIRPYVGKMLRWRGGTTELAEISCESVGTIPEPNKRSILKLPRVAWVSESVLPKVDSNSPYSVDFHYKEHDQGTKTALRASSH
jgi:hypothetical protein